MNKENSRKLKLLKMWEILKQETDEKHPISTNELISRLREQGILVDRKILYSDIELLNENGYEVLCQRSRSNKYYVMDRSFDVPEVRILMDAVKSAGFITEKKTESLINKIAMLAGSKRGQVLKSDVTKFSTVKSNNENILYIIDTIIEAKEENKKIAFSYFKYDVNKKKVYKKSKENAEENKRYIINPVELVLDNDQYYLICYDDKHSNYTHYRVDRIDKIEKLDEDLVIYDWVKEKEIIKYRSELFSMYSGEAKEISFVADKDLLDVIYDKFGDRVSIKVLGEGKIRCNVTIQNSPMLVAWCCSFTSRLKVESPPSLVKSIKEHLTSTINQYE